MTQLPHGVERRGFIGRIIAVAAAVVATGPSRLLAEESLQGDDWMKSLTGVHRTVFDVTAVKDGKPLGKLKNHLDGWRDAFKVPERDVNVVVGLHGDAAPFVLNDAFWARYKLGEQYNVMDGSMKMAATQNVFTTAHAASAGLVTNEQSIEALQQRGVRFLICMNTIGALSRRLAAAGMGTADQVRTAILGSLLPSVITVPTMNVTLTQLQEIGVKYQKIVIDG